MRDKEAPIIVSPFVEHRVKCGLPGCDHAARAIVRYPDAALPFLRQVYLCGAHAIRAMAKAFDAGLTVQEEGTSNAARIRRSS